MADKIPVSVVIITKDEEQRIVDCLKSVQFANEIIVCDTGSTDRTREIALSLGARVEEIPFQGYGPTKQAAIEMASEPWVLSLDSDERIPVTLQREIAKIVSRSDSKDGYEIPRLTWLWGKAIHHGGWYPGYVLRLFRNGKGQFTPSKVHERILVSGETGRLHSPIEHHTNTTFPDYLTKLDHFTTLAAKELIRNGRFRPSLIRILSRSVFTFFRMYLLQSGWKDGLHGFLLAGSSSFSTFLKYTKALMMKNGSGKIFLP